MAEIVNLRQARKRKARDDKARTAEANRAKFGRSKDEKAISAAEAARQSRLLDGHKRDEDH